MIEDDYIRLLDAVARDIAEQSAASRAALVELLNSGAVPAAAVWESLRQFEGAYYETLASAYGQVLSATGFGVQQIRALPVSGLSLSSHLYGFQKTVSAEVLGIIRRHATGMNDARKLAMDIYEGYGFKGGADALKLTPANKALPRYLREVLRDGGVRAELGRVIARGQVSGLRSSALRAAYTEALDAFDKGAGQKRLDNVLKVALEERQRYFANRIAQTELHRAYSDEKAREFMGEKALSVLQIKMSSTHPKLDICDMHANLNKYGLGPGCYPKALAPKPGFHPFCRCVLQPRWDLNAANAKVRAKAEQAFLIGAGDDGAKIMGSRAKLIEAKSGKTGVEDILNRNKDPMYHLARVGDVEA